MHFFEDPDDIETVELSDGSAVDSPQPRSIARLTGDTAPCSSTTANAQAAASAESADADARAAAEADCTSWTVEVAAEEEGAGLDEESYSLDEMAVYAEFEELCRRMRAYDESYCARTPGMDYQGTPPLSLAHEFEALAKRAPDEEDQAVCAELADQVNQWRAEAAKKEEARAARLALEAKAVADAKAVVEARAKREADEARTKALAEAKARAAAAAASSSAAELGPASSRKTAWEDGVDGAGTAGEAGDGDDEDADEMVYSRPPEEGVEFRFGELPEEAVCQILHFLPHWDVGRMACVSRELRRLTEEDDATWQAVQTRDRRHPSRPLPGGTWKQAFHRSLQIDRNWKRQRFERTEHRQHLSYVAAVALRGDRLLCASEDESASIMGMPVRVAPGAAEDYFRTGQAGGKFWETCIGKLVGHRAPVTGCAFLDDDTAITSSANGDVCLWDLSSVPSSPYEISGHPRHARPERGSEEGECPRSPSGSGGGAEGAGEGEGTGGRVHSTWGIAAEAFTAPPPTSPTRQVKSEHVGKLEKVVVTWKDRKELNKPQVHAQVIDVASGWSPQLMACSAFDHRVGIHVYDLARNWAAVRVYDCPCEVYSVKWNAATRTLFSACADSKIRFWDLRQKFHRMASFSASSRGAVRSVATEENIVASCAADGSVSVYDLRRLGHPLLSQRLHQGYANSVALDVKLGWVLTGGDDCTVIGIRLSTLQHRPMVNTPTGVLCVNFDHSRIAVGCEDSVVRVWDADVQSALSSDDMRESMAMAMRNLSIRNNPWQHGTGGGSGFTLTPAPDSQRRRLERELGRSMPGVGPVPEASQQF